MKRDLRFAKFVVILNALVPGAVLAWDAYHHQLGANGVNFALHTTGLLALIALLLTLTVTPLRKLTGWNVLISFRRALGLTAFFYACLHFLIFFVLDRALSVRSTIHEVLVRRYLVVGTVGLLVLAVLAATSTNAMVMRLGARRWKALHRLTYVAAIAGALHYYMLVKSDVRQPLAFAAVLAGLLGFRVVRALLDRAQAHRARGPARAAGVTRALPSSPPPDGAVSQPGPGARARYWTGGLQVARITQETPDVRTFRLTAADGISPLPFVHLPGQYLNVALTVDGKRVNRSYTIASSPTQRDYCEITVKRSMAGYASWHLHDRIAAQSSLAVGAPAGRFVFTGEGADRVVLIAGGVGITPLMSMVRYLTDIRWGGAIYLLFSVRRQSDVIFADELRALEQLFPRFHLCITLTKDEPPAGSSSSWRGARGAITGALLTSFVPDLVSAPIFLCGPDGMMASMQALLRERGVPEGNVHTEAFLSPAPGASVEGETATLSLENVASPSSGASPQPPGTAGSILFQRSERLVDSAGGETILESAEAAGLNLPFECRSGICGQCKMLLVAGAVRMDSEDALSASEKSRGLILACQAHPRGAITVDA